MASLYFYFNATTGDLVYSDKATYSGSGYTSLGQQTNTRPLYSTEWVFHSRRSTIKTVTKDPAFTVKISVLSSMQHMFNGCSSLTSVDLSGFDTSKVAILGNMFGSCSSVTSLDLSGFDTSKVTNMAIMFNGCSALRIIDISPNMSNVLSQLPAATYYDAATKQSYAKANIPGGSTYVRDLADLDLLSTMIQDRQAVRSVRHMANKLSKRVVALESSVFSLV